MRKNRPNWVIGTACWGLRVDEPAEFEHVKRMAASLDYVIEVNELTAEKGIRPRICRELGIAFGSVGSAFVEPPQHWQRLRWFLPTAYAAAAATKRLYEDGGRASENYYRLFANPGDEVSWRSTAIMLAQPGTDPSEAVRQALANVYGGERWNPRPARQLVPAGRERLPQPQQLQGGPGANLAGAPDLGSQSLGGRASHLFPRPHDRRRPRRLRP